MNLKVVTLVHDIYEDLELWYPAIRLRENGITVKLAGPEAGKIYKGKNGIPAKADISFDDLNAEEFDGVLIPGGYAPDKLRRNNKVTEFIKKMNDAQKPIGIICHAGWVAISAGILKNRKATSVGAIQDDMKNAGAQWVDEAVVQDSNLVSSRTPADLHLYVKTYIEQLQNSK
ncbi:MAG: type 1 glutamine amidotransferase domain-containing protein [Bacteroidales bacterium]